MDTIIIQMLFKKQALKSYFEHIFVTKRCNRDFLVLLPSQKYQSRNLYSDFGFIINVY